MKYKWRVLTAAPDVSGLYVVAPSPTSNETGGVTSFGVSRRPVPFYALPDWGPGYRTLRGARKAATTAMAAGLYAKVLPLRS